VRFNEIAQLDPIQVEDQRGQSAGMGGDSFDRSGFGIQIAVGGGGVGLLLMLIVVA